MWPLSGVGGIKLLMDDLYNNDKVFSDFPSSSDAVDDDALDSTEEIGTSINSG